MSHAGVLGQALRDAGRLRNIDDGGNEGECMKSFLRFRYSAALAPGARYCEAGWLGFGRAAAPNSFSRNVPLA